MTVQTPASPTPPANRAPLIWGVFIFLALVGGFAACTASVLGQAPKHVGATSRDAERQCQDWVKEKLKAPATAQFTATQSTGGPASWQVTGKVDSENSFGALMRSSWTCTISSDGTKWRGSTNVAE
jgi:hypothetical protein